MKRWILISLFFVGVGQAYSQTIVEDFFTPDGGSSPITLNGGQKCAQRFTATQPFEGIEVNGPTWSVNGEKGMTISLYHWAGTYDQTVSQEPIVTRVLENLNDNDWFPCPAPTELPPGEYLWEASDPTNSNPDAIDPHQIGCWLWNGSSYADGEAFFNGVPYGDVSVEWIRWYGDGQDGANWFPFAFPDTEDPSLAQSFSVPFTFQAVGIASPTWNGFGAGFRISLYEWDTDYETTVAQTPIGQTVIENHSDNARAELILDAPQLEGNYLIVTDQPNRGSGNVGHWGWNDSVWWDDDNIAFSNGLEIETFASFDLFVGEPISETVGKDFASRSVTGVATVVKEWALF